MTAIPKRKYVSIVLRVCILSFVAVVIGLNIYSWNAKSLVGSALPMPFGYGSAVVLSGSMEPTLCVDDLIFVQKQDTYEIGDIVVFRDGESLTVHRLVQIDEYQAITKGDANQSCDSPIEIGRIIGKVCGRISGVGVVVRALKTPIGIISLLCGALFLSELSFYKAKKADAEKVKALKEEVQKLREEKEMR